MGSFSGFKWIEMWIMLVAGGLMLVGAYLMSKPLNALLLFGNPMYSSSLVWGRHLVSLDRT
jgi:ABC-type Fe3+-siderophore transport system permease subunit